MTARLRSGIVRAYGSRYWIPALSVVAFLALVVSTWVMVQFTRAQADREADRIAADVEGCQRGNTLRLQVRSIGEANEQLVVDILETVFSTAGRSPEASERIDELRAQLDPVLDHYRAQVDDIEIVDCEALTPGATPTSGG